MAKAKRVLRGASKAAIAADNVVAFGRGHTADLAASWRRERPDLANGNHMLAIYAMRLGRILDDAHDRMCREKFGISGAEMRIVFALRRAGKPYARRPTDLFRALLVTSGAITKQVDRLVQAKLVRRIPDPAFAGGVLILLTKQGLKVADEGITIVSKWLVSPTLLRTMTKEEVRQFERACATILYDMEASPPDPLKA